MAVSPDRRFLYVGVRGQPQIVASFAIDPASGRLTYLASGPLADSMAYLVTDRTGRFLLGASYPGHKLTVNPIEPSGIVQAPQQVVPNQPHAHAILVDAQNRYVLAPTLGNDCVSQFTFDASTGLLAPNTPPSVRLQAKSGPRHVVFHPNGSFVYVLGERDGSMTVLDYEVSTGQLREKQRVSALPPGFQGSPLAADLHLTPDGRFLYGSERTSSTLTGFRVDPITARCRRLAASRPQRSRGGSISTPPAATCSRWDSCPMRSRSTKSTRLRGTSRSSTTTRWGTIPTGWKSWSCPTLLIVSPPEHFTPCCTVVGQ